MFKLGFLGKWGLMTLALGLVTASVLAEGTQTGILVGQVLDSSGTAVQGASVKLLGARGSRTAVTAQDGRFRIPALPVGTYQAKAELPGVGLESDARPVEVFIDRTTEVELALVPPDQASEPVEMEALEVIQVSAEAPLIDPFDARLGGNVRYGLIDELPLERFYQSVALMLPGVAGGQDGNPNVNGSLDSHNLYLIDGVDTTDPTTGLFGLNLNYEAIQEVAVTTGGLPAEFGRASGGVINVVTRSGSNDFEGRVRWVATNRDWNEDYERASRAPAFIEREIEVANSGPDDVDDNVAISFGGPIVQDRFWFFAAYEEPESSFRRPVFEGADFWDRRAEGERQAYKLTWSVNSSHTVTGQYTADSTDFRDFQPFVAGPSRNVGEGLLDMGSVNAVPGDRFAVEARTQDGEFSTIQWNGLLGSDLAIDVTVAEQERTLDRSQAFSRSPTANAPHLDLSILQDFDALAIFNGPTTEGFEDRNREQVSLGLSWFLGRSDLKHDLRVGFDLQETESIALLQVPGVAGVDRFTGNRVHGQLFLDDFFLGGSGENQPFALWNFWRRSPRQTTEQITAVYIADGMASDRWFLDLGLRLEDFNAEEASGQNLIDDQTIDPRIALTLDLTGRGTTLLTASFGRYREPVLQKFTDLFERTDFLSGFTQYVFIGFGGGCTSENVEDPASPCWLTPFEIDPDNPPLGTVFDLQPLATAQGELDIDRSFVDEWTLGVEQQVTDDLGISLHFVDREWGNLWDDVLFVDEDGFVRSETRNIDFARREHQAVQIAVQKRYSNRWQLLGSYTWSETEGNLFRNDGLSFFADFLDQSDSGITNRFGPAPYDRKNQLKAFANYQVPLKERVALSIGSAFRYESGVPFEQVSFDEDRFITPRGSQRLDDVFQWDLSFALDVPVWRDLELEVKTEVFNVTDEQEQTGAERFVDFNTFGQPRSIFDLQAPRSYRLTLGVRF